MVDIGGMDLLWNGVQTEGTRKHSFERGVPKLSDVRDNGQECEPVIKD